MHRVFLENTTLSVDGTDNFAAKFLINDAAYKFQIPMVYGAVNGFEGQAALFFGKHGACYRCLYPEFPKAQIRNCAEAGVLGSVVGVIGTLQATLALEYLISQGDGSHSLCPQIGHLTLIDLKGSFGFRSVSVPKKPKCSTCSLPAEEVQLPKDSMDVCQSVNQIRPDELKSLLLGSNPKVFLLDVREKDEWEAGHLEVASHFPLSRIENGELPTLPVDVEKIIVYCQSGIRSARATSILNQAMEEAHTPIYNLIGGLNSWSGPLKQG
jgi:rhodanese-related sulfurtransferase